MKTKVAYYRTAASRSSYLLAFAFIPFTSTTTFFSAATQSFSFFLT